MQTTFAEPSSNRRHILIALLGRTPQILTETLYALCVDRGVPISEVWVISTQEGYHLALEKLLAPEHGQFYKMQKDYPEQYGNIRFSAEHILVASDGLLPVEDIRSRKGQREFSRTDSARAVGENPRSADGGTQE